MSDRGISRKHSMPFGAEIAGDRVRFRIWAPSAERVDLLVGDPESGRIEERPMERHPDGFWESVASSPAGALYRYRVNGEHEVPDPASRFQPRDVHGPSELVDPAAFSWNDTDWRGRPWEETVLYELHPGAFSPDAGYDGVRRALDRIAGLGVTAVELMPLSDFPGRRNWGYDGVLPFAPDSSYGRPEDLKRLVAAAHRRDLSVFLDVVYNHFGPEGNYLHLYARSFFNPRKRTPWGDAIHFDGPQSRTVRDFFVHNALYWLEEYHLDGLRLDAVHAIHDDSSPTFLDELARRVHEGPGARRPIHLVLENHANEAHRLRRGTAGRPRTFVAQWNDDAHHAFHCLLTGESGGYYADFAGEPARHLARALAEGFAWQGEFSEYTSSERGEPSAHLPPTAFVNFLQNHDQIGNRAFGERLTEIVGTRQMEAAIAILLLSPAPPMLFMGEEYGSRVPFPFFCDFGADLARAVTEGRRREFDRFPEFRDAVARERIPDPNAPSTFESAVLDDAERDGPDAQERLELCRTLLELRRREIVPRLTGAGERSGSWTLLDDRSIRVEWILGDGSRLTLLARLGPGNGPRIEDPPGRRIWPSEQHRPSGNGGRALAPWSVVWFLDEEGK